MAKTKGKKCLNLACEWNKDGECLLFPGDWGFLTCKHSDEVTTKPTTKSTTKKGRK